MSAPCLTRNPLQRDGTSRPARDLPALDPRSAPIDGRGLPEMVMYLREHAARIRCPDAAGRDAGRMSAFFARDPSFVLAEILAARVGRSLVKAGAVNRRLATLKAGREEALRLLPGVLKDVFQAVKRLDDWLRFAAPDRLALPDALRQSLVPGLRPTLKLLVGVYRAAAGAPLNVSEPSSADLKALRLDRLWWTDDESGPAAWDVFFDAVPAPAPALGETPAADVAIVARVAEYLAPIIKVVAGAVGGAELAARRDFDETLARWPGHEPQTALALAFLHAYRHASAQLDRLTERHLDSYYRRVLRLAPLEAESDRVHVVFTAAKGVEAVTVEKGALFPAGKDPGKAERLYELADDMRVNRAVVGPFLAVNRIDGATVSTPGGTLRATRAADALGAPPTPSRPNWRPFGREDDPTARVGFAVSGPVLRLPGGVRTVTLTLAFVPETDADVVHDLTAAGGGSGFVVELTTPKGWTQAGAAVAPTDAGAGVTLTLTLDAKAPPVVDHDPAAHGPEFAGAGAPVCRVLLRQESGLVYARAAGLVLESVKVHVKADEVRHMQVITEVGPVDPAKPFAPFGGQPLPGASFVVRLPELADKSVTRFVLPFAWKDLPPRPLAKYFEEYAPGAAVSATADAELLRELKRLGVPNSMLAAVAAEIAGGKGGGPSKEVGKNPTSEDFEVVVRPGDRPSGAGASRTTIDDAADATATLHGPFPDGTDAVRAEFDGPSYGFGHRAYPALMAKAAMVLAEAIRKNRPQPPLPEVPFTPMLSGLTCAYEAEATAGDGRTSLHHVHPFGVSRPPTSRPTLLPAYGDEGLLYVGLAHARADERVAVLFLLDEGTADPRFPAPKIAWEYLSASSGEFTAFDDARISDGTRGLAHSGVVHVTLPAAAFAAGGADLMRTAVVSGEADPPGRAWLRARAPTNTAATCSAFSAAAQAAEARLVAPESHPTHPFGALPPRTISKMAQRPAGIKAVAQPGPSFGGRPDETDASFRRRASERLRHKRRAIAVHDYEVLVLDAFPELYKVKCLNHTRLSESGAADHEIAPGHATVVVIPNLRGRRDPNPFQPFASQATLKAVEDFLKPLVGGFVAAKAANPVFERVRVTAGVRFREELHLDPALGAERLRHELDAFLCPWAFPAPEGTEADVVFGRRISRSQILYFLETRGAVDYVADLEVVGLDTSVADGEDVRAGSSRAVLVSAGDHVFTPILDEDPR